MKPFKIEDFNRYATRSPLLSFIFSLIPYLLSIKIHIVSLVEEKPIKTKKVRMISGRATSRTLTPDKW